MNYEIVSLGEKIMNMSKAIGIVTAGTLIFYVVDIAKSGYVRDRDIATNQGNHEQQSPAQIDRSNRERAKDYAFLYNNPSLEEPMYQKLSKTATKANR